MNKFLSALVALLAVTFLFTACSKSPDKILDRKDGRWDAVMTTVAEIPGYGTISNEQSGTFFFENSKYTLTMSNGETVSGTWIANAKKVTFITNSEVMELDVIKSSRKEQEWRSLPPGNSSRIEVIFKLKR